MENFTLLKLSQTSSTVHFSERNCEMKSTYRLHLIFYFSYSWHLCNACLMFTITTCDKLHEMSLWY